MNRFWPKPRPVQQFALGPVPQVPKSAIVVRRDLRQLPPNEQVRVVEALEKMMEPGWTAYQGSGVPDNFPSEYFRLASYHGWPQEYCEHGRETFPGWHRAYLCELEKTVQAADQALGRDGHIAFPYWGWDSGAVNGQMMPQIVRERFATLRPDLIPDQSQPIATQGYRLADEATLAQGMSRSRIEDQVRLALQQMQHPLAASTAGRNANSVETPHNTMHVLCGFPMTSVDYAAFHPIFFFHHCNVDRIYEAYLQKDMQLTGNGAGAPWREFEVSDAARYSAPLEPFKHPATGEPFLPHHTFLTEAIGYRYDALPSIPPARLSEMPTLAHFEDVQPTNLAGRSYALHVFVAAADDTHFVPPANVAEYDSVPQYAGLNGVFGSKAGECQNCSTRAPVDIQVDVTEALRRQGLSRHTARPVVVCVDMASGQELTCAQARVPEPQLVGPFFEDTSLMLDRKAAPGQASGVEEGEAAQLQRYLKKFGWYRDEVDGFFGPVTEGAVRKFQEFYGLTVDGVAGPETRTAMMAPRVDDGEDEVDADDTATFAPATAVRWWAGGCPGYLGEAAVKDEVEAALRCWGEVLPLAFVEVGTAEEAQLVVTWGDRSRDNMFRFDGPGGALAYTQGSSITLDVSEYWLLQGAQERPGAFYLQPVVLHEIGHALGLTHSNSPQDVMSPFYVPDRIRLTSSDRRRATETYPVPDDIAEAFRALDADRDGLLGKAEFLTAMCERGEQPLQRSDAEQLFDMCDYNASGALRLVEFASLMARLRFA